MYMYVGELLAPTDNIISCVYELPESSQSYVGMYASLALLKFHVLFLSRQTRGSSGPAASQGNVVTCNATQMVREKVSTKPRGMSSGDCERPVY